MRKILVLGATSGMAIETLRNFAADGAALFLVGRSSAKLEVVKNDLAVRGAALVAAMSADLSETNTHEKIFSEAQNALSGLDTVLLAYGVLGHESEAQSSYEKAFEVFNVNFLSAVSLLTLAAERFEKQGQGQIAVISSVAGDRGRKSNYIYGASKAALGTYLQGLRNRLFSKGVNVLTVKPGFVDTPMTKEIKKGPLFADAKNVGKGIYDAMQKRKDVVYLPWFWRPIMLIIKHIPECVFKRLSL